MKIAHLGVTVSSRWGLRPAPTVSGMAGVAILICLIAFAAISATIVGA
jgi:hypothetical protein